MELVFVGSLSPLYPRPYIGQKGENGFFSLLFVSLVFQDHNKSSICSTVFDYGTILSDRQIDR